MNLPLPNIYFVTVDSAVTGAVHHLYVAADFSGAAIRKVQNICADRYNFRPYRSNSVIKMRRMRLHDYVQDPSITRKAAETALSLGETDIVWALEKRPAEVQAMLSAPIPSEPPVDFDELAARLRDELQTLDRLPTKEAV